LMNIARVRASGRLPLTLPLRGSLPLHALPPPFPPALAEEG
jgi:hypothetical protein